MWPQEGGAGGGVRAAPQLRGPTGHRLIWGGEGDQGVDKENQTGSY